MSKKSLLYASPFPPQKSGISDYSVELAHALEKHFDVTLFTDNYKVKHSLIANIPVVRYGEDEIDFDKYDYLVYNVGNNPDFHSYIYEAALAHPGMIILHDYMLYYLFVGYYQRKRQLYSKLYNATGTETFLKMKHIIKKNGSNLLEQKGNASIAPFNDELLASGNKIMVHSEYARKRIIDTGLVSEDKVRKINQLYYSEYEGKKSINKDLLYAKFNIPKDAVIIASFGFIAETKLNKEVCRVVKELSNESDKKLCYVMVGEGNYADSELEEGKVIKTGYTNIDEFNSFIDHADIIVSLRGVSMGETSGAMIRIFQYGKCCITNGGGWFSELPDDSVIKIELDDVEKNLKEALSDLIENDDKKRSYEKNARAFVERDNAPDVVCEHIKAFLEE